MIFVELTDAEYRQLSIDQKAQYWADRYYHTKELLDADRRQLDILNMQVRRIQDILDSLRQAQ